jgi:hypothetical protein
MNETAKVDDDSDPMFIEIIGLQTILASILLGSVLAAPIAVAIKIAVIAGVALLWYRICEDSINHGLLEEGNTSLALQILSESERMRNVYC